MSKFEYTHEQKDAITLMKRFLNGEFPGEYEFSLIGAAGTGKTTILKEVVKEYPKSLVFGATVSHAAKNVLKENAGDWMNCYTIASLLNLTPSIDHRTGKQIFVPAKTKRVPPVTEAKILIIDESSMIDESIRTFIRNTIMEGTFIIYSGDKYQLPPVTDGDNENTISPTFDCTLKAELTIPMRFDDIIGESALYYRETIKICEQYKGINVDSFNNWKPVKSNGTSSIEFTSDYTYFMNKAMASFYNDRKHTRMLAYRNYTINQLNDYIRKQFYPYHDDNYVEGEYIITNKPYGDKIHNGEIFYISDVNIGFVQATGLEAKQNVKGYKQVQLPIKVYNLEVTREQGDDFIVDELPIVHEDSLETFNSMKQDLINIAKQNKVWWKMYYKFLESFADVSKTYLTSTHKSQGQSIENVFVMANDIMAVSKISLQVKLQSLYVAVTRAKKNLTVLI